MTLTIQSPFTKSGKTINNSQVHTSSTSPAILRNVREHNIPTREQQIKTMLAV